MANTGNTQQQIDYGAAANDGTGDPLRTAFIKTDDNFDNIWLAGPVGSNITIVNNTVQANNTNGNLILSPNGTGVVQTNSKLLPRLTNTYDLGSSALKYRAGYFGAGGLTVDGNVTITGNLTAGNISYTSNVFVGDLQGSVFADDSTIMVDAIDNVLYAGRAAISGNVSATYFIGNGSQLTGLAATYGNANVVANLAALGSNPVSTTGNISGNFFVGNGRSLTGITSSYGNANVVANLAALGSNPVSTTGNISGNYFIGNGSQLTGMAATYGNANVVANLAALGSNPVSTTGNISGNFFIGNGSLLTGLAATYGNANVVANLAALGSNPVSTTGNVTASYFIGNGSLLTSLPAPAVTQDITSNGAMSLMTYDGVIKYVSYATVEPSSGNLTAGNVSSTGNITAGNLIATGNIVLTGSLVGSGASPAPSLSGFSTISTTGATGNITASGNINGVGATFSGNITGNYFIGNGSQLTGISGGANTGNVTFRDEIVIGTGTSNLVSGLYLAPSSSSANANMYLRVRGNVIDEPTHIHFDTGNNAYYNQFIGDDNKYILLANTGNVVVNTNDTVGNSAQWTFDNFGTLALPGGSRLRPLGANLDIFAGTGSYVNLITSNESSYMGVGGAGGYVVTAGGTWNFNTNGNLTAPGNVSAVGNITGGNLITAGSGGNITMTGGNITGAGNIAAGNVSTTGNVTGNYILGNGSQLTGIVSSYGNANVVANLAALGSNPVSTTGNITGGNILGGANVNATTHTGTTVSVTGNITGGNIATAGQVSATGNVTAANFFGNGNTLSNVATTFESTWTVPTGNSTQSFTVTPNNTYYMWVDCNIPNGILTWNATATVTNTNVPVVGAQYAWVYTGGGTPIDFTSIPNQFVGTANTIVRSSVAPSATTNRFDFGINNTSGNTVTVNYGYARIS